MVVNQYVSIKISSNHLEYYRNLGYNVKYMDIVNIYYKHLTVGSRGIISLRCDNCMKNIEMQYRTVHKKIGENGEYTCGKCVHSEIGKIKMTKESKEKMINSNKNTWSKKKENGDIEKIKIKIKETKKRKYNDSRFNNMKKRNETMITKYGKLSGVNEEKKKQTCLEKYSNPTFNNQKKKKQTCLEKYGVEHTNQDENVFNKILKNSFKINTEPLTGLKYQSKNERIFLEYCHHNKIKVETAKKVIYFFEKERVYYPDFYLPKYNLIVEIKSSYTYNKDLDKNRAKKEYSIKCGFDFIFIIDNDFKKLEEFILRK